ncbi:hypothetical protein AAEU32_05200 [Pseudoalteromonas sp. SSDWG2]
MQVEMLTQQELEFIFTVFNEQENMTDQHASHHHEHHVEEEAAN